MYMQEIEIKEKGVISELVQKHRDSLIILQSENTGFVQKFVVMNAMTKQLSANRNVFHEYFKHRMDERKQIIQTGNELLEQAIKKGNVELAQSALQLIHMLKSTEC